MDEQITERQSGRILVVDDTSANLQLLTNLLTGHGYTVHPASDGELALEFVRTTLPDLILLDIRMPEMDGYEVCRRLKADKRTRDIPVIFISILEDERDKVKGFQTGAVDYITKPFQAEEVLARVKIHLDLRELTEHLGKMVIERTEELHSANAQLQHELSERIKFFESMEKINLAIQGASNLEQGMGDILDTVLEVFDCDRAYLATPLDPGAANLSVLMERCKPENPGATMQGIEIPVDPEQAEFMRVLLDTDGPVKSGPGCPYQIPEAMAEQFSIKSYINMALHPKLGKPWRFGLHQCTHERIWTADEERLFQQIGRRLADGLTTLLAHRDLEESEERMRLTLAATQIGIFDWDVERDTWYASPEYYTMLGYEPKDGPGDRKEWMALVHPDDRAHVETEIRRVLRKDASPDHPRDYAYEARLRHADGSYRWQQIKGFSIRRDQQGRVTRMLGIRMDINEQKKAEQERAAHLHFLESMGSTSRAIHGSNDLEIMMTDVLDVMLSVFDCDRAWLVHPCDPDAPSCSVPMERTKPEYPGASVLGQEIPMSEDVAEVFRTQLSFEGPVKYRLGTEYPLAEDVAKQFGIKSQISISLHPKVGRPWQFGMHQCSHPRQWTAAEEKLFQEIGIRIEDGLSSLLSYRKLQESEERYHLVFENSPVALWEEDLSGVKSFLDDLKMQGVTDIETYLDGHPKAIQRCMDRIKVLDVNRASLTLYGAANKDELLAGLEKTLTPASFDYFRKELVCLWNGETEMKSDAVVKTFTGDLRIVTISFSVCPGYEETLSKVIVSMDDITQRKEAEEALRQLNMELDQRVLNRTAELEAANKELEGFTYSVSHDLRAPLRHIDGFLELLRKKAGTAWDEEARHYMDNVSGAAQKMGLLVDDLLAFSRMGRHAVTLEPVDLGSLVHGILEEFGPDTAGRKIDWRIGDLPVVRGDGAMLRMVFFNLISNAVKFTQPRPQAKIEIGCMGSQEAETVIFVRDNGVGFDMAYGEKLFGVFQRLHRQEEFEGTGIGLANARRIISRHGGRTWAEGKTDQGATFYFSLPQQIQEA